MQISTLYASFDFGNMVFVIWQQTSTADMLDLAVDYIKDLQEQVQVLENYYIPCHI
jgi:hypothetical protein